MTMVMTTQQLPPTFKCFCSNKVLNSQVLQCFTIPLEWDEQDEHPHLILSLY